MTCNSPKANYNSCMLDGIICSENAGTFGYYKKLEEMSTRVKIVTWKSEGGFHYSAINNFGAGFARGEYLLLLNNDIRYQRFSPPLVSCPIDAGRNAILRHCRQLKPLIMCKKCASARLKGISLALWILCSRIFASGDYLIFLDHDDTLSEDALYEVARAAEGGAELLITYLICQFLFYNTQMARCQGNGKPSETWFGGNRSGAETRYRKEWRLPVCGGDKND